MTHYLCITCEILARPIYLAAAYSPHVIDIELIHRGLHEETGKLQATLQEHINQAEGKGYQAILLGYGLCGNGTVGLRSHSIPLVIPRVHDCITLLLGDARRYEQEFEKTPGTFWYSQDFMERHDDSGKFSSLGPITEQKLAKQYQTFVEKYGKDNADYLMETLCAWQTYYQRAVFIDMQCANTESLVSQAENEARQRGWIFEKLTGDLVLLRHLLNGDWSENESKDFCVVPPIHTVEATFNETIFRCSPA